MPELPESASAVTCGGYQGDGGNMTFTFGGLDAEVARLRATLAEVRQAVTTFRSHYAATLDDQASDVITAVLQVLDRVPLETQERSNEKEGPQS